MNRLASCLAASRLVTGRVGHGQESVPHDDAVPASATTAVCRAPSPARLSRRMASLGIDHAQPGTPGICGCGTPLVLDELYGWMHIKTVVTEQDCLQVLAVLEELT